MTKLFSTHQANLLAALFFLLSTPLTSLAQPQEAQNLTTQNCQYLNRVRSKTQKPIIQITLRH